MTETFTFSDNVHRPGCPFPRCSKGNLCRKHSALLPESILEEGDYRRMYRYFQTRLQLSDLITARSPQAESESETAPDSQVSGKAHAAPTVKGSLRTAPQAGPAAPLPKLICAWHKPEPIVLRDGPEPASHGMCRECEARVVA